MSQFTNHNKLIEALDYRIGIIEESKNLLESGLSERYQKQKRKEYYFNVAYFVHTVWENYDLRILFDELLSYKLKLSHKADYLNVVKKINASIKSIALYLLSQPKFITYEEKYQLLQWVNPFEGFPLLKTRTLLERLASINDKENKLKSSYNDIYNIFLRGDGLNGILEKWIKDFGSDGFHQIEKSIDEFANGLRFLTFHEQFQYDYLGVNAGLEIQNIYRNLHPLFIPSEINEAIINNFIKAGDVLPEANLLLAHCKRIREYFKQRLNTKFSIGILTHRFKNYMELYYNSKGSKQTERIFQKEFELFMFNNGYFPLSEGQLGNARYDNIILNENNAFLCEHKQIKTSESKGNSLRKIRSAKIQAKIYHDRLGSFPSLSRDIYIFLFSESFLKFKNNDSEIQKYGLNFKFILICLNKKTSPSKVKKIEDIDINELIE